MALVGLMGTAQASQPVLTHNEAKSADFKATGAKHTTRAERKVHSVGGLDLIQTGEYGMSPKEYGIRYGHGNKASRGNRLRLSHNAKLKRRGY